MAGAAGPRKTRHASGSKVGEYIGVGQDFLPSEVPTLRGSLRKILLLQEKYIMEEDGDRRNLPMSILMLEVAESIVLSGVKAATSLHPQSF